MTSFRQAAAALVLGFAALAGCGGAPGGSKTLFTDDFSGSLGASWFVVTGAGTALASSATSGDPDTLGALPHGNPSPGLWMKGASFGTAPGGGGGVRSVFSYPTSGGLTVGADLRKDSGVEPSAGGVLFRLTDISGGQPLAMVEVDSGSATFLLTIHDPASGNHAQQVTHAFPADTVFHRYEFSVDSAGNAAWTRDGALQQTVPAFPASRNLSIQVTGPGSTDAEVGSGHLDNVKVTAP
jgi:hypothetical protein